MLKANKFVKIVWTVSFLLCSFTTKNGIVVKLGGVEGGGGGVGTPKKKKKMQVDRLLK